MAWQLGRPKAWGHSGAWGFEIEAVTRVGLEALSADSNLESGAMGTSPALGFAGVGLVWETEANYSAYILLLPRHRGYLFPHCAVWEWGKSGTGNVKLSFLPS